MYISIKIMDSKVGHKITFLLSFIANLPSFIKILLINVKKNYNKVIYKELFKRK